MQRLRRSLLGLAIVALAGQAQSLDVPQASIGAADLQHGRALLEQARGQLKPQHWEVLARELKDAEVAFQRFSKVAAQSGRAATVARNAGAVAEAGRAAQAAEGLTAERAALQLARAGPMLAALILLWPSSTAGPELDRAPPWLGAQLELEDKLLKVSSSAKDVAEQLRAIQRQEAAGAGRKPQVFEDGVKCTLVGSGGGGMPGRETTCTYVCQGIEVVLKLEPFETRCPGYGLPGNIIEWSRIKHLNQKLPKR